MHLNDEQAVRYHAVMASLLAYAERVLGVTQEQPIYGSNELTIERACLVAHELWRHPTIISGFVAHNPDSLSDACLEVARAWTDALVCRCAVVGFDDQGAALVETEAGAFAASGVAHEPSETFTMTPVVVRGVLLPFDEVIILGSLGGGLARPGNGEMARMRERARAGGFVGVASTARELRLRSKRHSHLCAVRQSAEDAGGAHVSVSGFHCGRLARIAADERRAYADRHARSFLRGVAGEPAPSGDSASLAPRVAAACAMLYGVISLDDAYEQCAGLYASLLSRATFEDGVIEAAKGLGCGYGIWESGGTRYVVAPALSEAGAFSQAVAAIERFWDDDGGCDALMLDDVLRDELDVLMEDELARLRKLCAALRACQVGGTRRPLERRMIERGMVSCFLDMDAVIMLRDFLDAHVPDGQDDHRFADGLVCAMAYLFVTGGADVSVAYDLLFRYHLMHCEAAPWSDVLGRMVVNLYNSLPRWERGGWSLREIRERLTGRHTTYAPDGTVVRGRRRRPDAPG